MGNCVVKASSGRGIKEKTGFLDIQKLDALELVDVLKFGTQKYQILAARQLAYLTQGSNLNNRKALLSFDVIEPTINLLNDSSDSSKAAASQLLCNMALDADARKRLSKHHHRTIPHLLHSLTSSIPGAGIIAAKALTNLTVSPQRTYVVPLLNCCQPLSAHASSIKLLQDPALTAEFAQFLLNVSLCPEIDDAFGKASGVEAILEMLQDARSSSPPFETLLQALYNVCIKSNRNLVAVRCSKGVDTLLLYLSTGSCNSKFVAVSLLGMLSRHGAREELLDKLCMEKLVGLLGADLKGCEFGEPALFHAQVVATMLDLCYNWRGAWHKSLSSPQAAALLCDMLDSRNACLQDAAVDLVCLLSCRKKPRHYLSRTHAAEKLVRMLPRDNRNVDAVARTLRNLVVGGVSNVPQRLIRAGAIPRMLDTLVNSHSFEARKQVLACLASMSNLLDSQASVEICRVQGAKVLTQLLQKALVGELPEPEQWAAWAAVVLLQLLNYEECSAAVMEGLQPLMGPQSDSADQGPCPMEVQLAVGQRLQSYSIGCDTSFLGQLLSDSEDGSSLSSFTLGTEYMDDDQVLEAMHSQSSLMTEGIGSF